MLVVFTSSINLILPVEKANAAPSDRDIPDPVPSGTIQVESTSVDLGPYPIVFRGFLVEDLGSERLCGFEFWQEGDSKSVFYATGTYNEGEDFCADLWYRVIKDTTYYWRALVRTGSWPSDTYYYGEIKTFNITDPEVETIGAIDISATCATLRGYLVDDAGADCSAYFEVYKGEDQFSYPYLTGPFYTGDYIEKTVIGLEPDSVYSFRVVIFGKNNGYLLWVFGDLLEFSTGSVAQPMIANDRGPTDITQTAATMRGEVVDNGEEDPHCYVYWGETDSGTNQVDWDNIYDLGIQDDLFYVRSFILTPGTTYYYRCYGENSAGGDWAGNTQVFTTLPGDNTAPVVNIDIGEQIIDEGNSFAAINLDDYVTDNEDPDSNLVWSYSGNVDLVVGITDRIATVSTPDIDWFGSEAITFTATDSGGLSDSDSVDFIVTSVNDAPNIIDIPDQIISKGETFTPIVLDDHVSDPDNIALDISWEYTGYSELSVIENSRIVNIITPSSDWVGSETITFTSRDPSGRSESDSATFTVFSTDINNPPIISNPSITNGKIDVSMDTISINIAIQDPEGGILKWTISTLPNIGSNSSEYDFNGKKNCSISGLDYNTKYTWYVNVTDGQSWTNRSFVFTTESENQNKDGDDGEGDGGDDDSGSSDSGDDDSSNDYIPPDDTPDTTDDETEDGSSNDEEQDSNSNDDKQGNDDESDVDETDAEDSKVYLLPVAKAEYTMQMNNKLIILNLDGSQSYDPDGGNITSWVWTLNNQTLGTESKITVILNNNVSNISEILNIILTVKDDEGQINQIRVQPKSQNNTTSLNEKTSQSQLFDTRTLILLAVLVVISVICLIIIYSHKKYNKNIKEQTQKIKEKPEDIDIAKKAASTYVILKYKKENTGEIQKQNNQPSSKDFVVNRDVESKKKQDAMRFLDQSRYSHNK